MRDVMAVEEDPVIIMSSTYIKTNNVEELVKRTNKEGSLIVERKPILLRV